MVITTTHKSPELMCKALTKIVEKNVGRVSCRPYNHRKATYTDWFIVPISDSWPAYKHGKYFSDWQGETDLLLGLMVEKGLGREAEQSRLYDSPKAKRWIMRKDWLWLQFLDDLKNGRVESTIAHVEKNAFVPVVIRFSGGYLDGAPDSDPYESLLKNDIYLLQYSTEPTDLRLIDSKPHAKLFTDLENTTTFKDLLSFINRMDDDDFLWLDILIGILLRYKDIENMPENEREEWTAEMIWDKVLKHFLPWFK